MARSPYGWRARGWAGFLTRMVRAILAVAASHTSCSGMRAPPVCPHLPRPRFLAIWTSPQLWEKITRKFISHHSRLTAKGFTDDEA
jgi:hypothetical protein